MEDTSPNSICTRCYAQQNRYRFPSVRDPQRARFAFLQSDPTSCLSHISSFLATHQPPFFRVHDSGDFHSRSIIHLWSDLVARHPYTSFWFPTRAWVFPAWHSALRTLALNPNATVRPSAIHFNDPPPSVPGLDPGTTSSDSPFPNIHDCPKAINHTSCDTESCRACWSPTNHVNYRPHGHRLTPLTIKVTNVHA